LTTEKQTFDLDVTLPYFGDRVSTNCCC